MITSTITHQSYEANGNMTHDGRRGLDLSWNHLNLPSSICSDEDEDALVNYTYLADGTKVLAEAPGTSEGYAYLGTMVYKLNNGSWVLETTPFTGGRFIANSTGGFDEYRYITDHLGSTRLIVKGYDYQPDERNDYYPFGMRIADNTLSTTQNNRWRFSGKEIQTLGGINLIDYGARLYDDYLGRWITQDPLADDYSWLNPYNYCSANPICLIDPFGTDIWEIDSEGTIVKRITDKTEDAVYLVDDKGERIYTKDKEGNKVYSSIHFSYGTIVSQDTKAFNDDGQRGSFDVYTVKGDNNGEELFTFLADNLTGKPGKVEVGLTKTGIEGSQGINYVTTSHMRTEYGQKYLVENYLIKGYTIRELRHSHAKNLTASQNDMEFKSAVIEGMKRYDNYLKINRKVPYFTIYSVQYRITVTFGNYN